MRRVADAQSAAVNTQASAVSARSRRGAATDRRQRWPAASRSCSPSALQFARCTSRRTGRCCSPTATADACEPPTLGAGKKAPFGSTALRRRQPHLPLPAERAAVKAAGSAEGRRRRPARSGPSCRGSTAATRLPLPSTRSCSWPTASSPTTSATSTGRSPAAKRARLSQSATFSSLTASGRTSTTWYVTYAAAHPLLARAAALTATLSTIARIPSSCATARARASRGTTTRCRRRCCHGGQRLATLLVYLNVPSEGAPPSDLRGSERLAPRKGRALFFPSADADGTLTSERCTPASPRRPTAARSGSPKSGCTSGHCDPTLPPGNTTPTPRRSCASTPPSTRCGGRIISIR